MKKYLMQSQEWCLYEFCNTAITIVDEDWMKSNGFLAESGRRFDNNISEQNGVAQSGYAYWWIPIDENGKVNVSDIEEVSGKLFKDFVYVPYDEDDIDDYLDDYPWDDDETTDE